MRAAAAEADIVDSEALKETPFAKDDKKPEKKPTPPLSNYLVSVTTFLIVANVLTMRSGYCLTAHNGTDTHSSSASFALLELASYVVPDPMTLADTEKLAGTPTCEHRLRKACSRL